VINSIIINSSQIIGTSDKGWRYFKKIFKPTDNQFKKINRLYFIPAKKGKFSKEDLLSKIAKEFGVTKKEALRHYMIGGKLLENNKANMKIIDDLRKRYKLVLVANSAALYASLPVEKALYKKYPVVLSFKAKSLVGTKRINKIALKRLKAKPSETLYIDYNPKNIEVAKKMGMKTILYKNNNQLKKELDKMLR
jgi:HAD superfamily hydrolase (TIGR01509 family)